MASSARRVLYAANMHTTPEEAGLRALSLVEELPDKERALALELLQALHQRAVLGVRRSTQAAPRPGDKSKH